MIEKIFFVIKALVLIRIRIRSGLSNSLVPDLDSKYLDPDTDSVNPEPGHWFFNHSSEHTSDSAMLAHRSYQGVTNRSPLSWLTNGTLVYELKSGGEGGGSCGVSANEYRCTQEPKQT